MNMGYGYMFSGFQTSRSNSNMFYGINFADYSSIRSGSYGKLLKAYYSGMGSKQTLSGNKNEVNNSTNKVQTSVNSVKKQELVELQKYTNELKSSSDKLLQKGSKSLFKSEYSEYKESDKVALYNAVSDFVSDYNNMLEKGSASTSGSIARISGRLDDSAGSNKRALESIGITLDLETGKMSINKDTFVNADMNQVKELFNKDNSFGYFVSQRTDLIEDAIENEARKNKIDVVSLKKEAELSSVDKNNSGSTNITGSTASDIRKQEMTSMQKYGDELEQAVNKLLQKGDLSLFKEEYTDEDRNTLYNAVSDFVSKLNIVLEKGKESSVGSIVRMTERLKDSVDDNEKMLKTIGIKVGEKKLTIDKDAFMNSDMKQVKKLFNETDSFGYFTQQKAESLESMAKLEANRKSLYSSKGTYNYMSTGILYSVSI